MKLHIVTEHFDHEGGRIRGVWTEPHKAAWQQGEVRKDTFADRVEVHTVDADTCLDNFDWISL